MPTINRRILLDDCDAAGVVFGPRVVALAHHAYEESLAAAGVDLAALIRAGELALPYVHLDCEFRAPMRHGDELRLAISCEKIGTTSFTMAIEFFRAAESCAKVRQTHVAITCATRTKTELPAAIRAALTSFTDCPV